MSVSETIQDSRFKIQKTDTDTIKNGGLLKTIYSNKYNKQSGRASVLILALIATFLLFLYFILAYKPHKAEITQKNDPMYAELIKKDTKETPQKSPEQTPPQAAPKQSEPLMVKSIQFLPENPTISDNIKVETKANYEARGITFEYKWMINQKVIDDIKGDTLPKGKFKKYDRVSVVITPYMDGAKGYPFGDNLVIIQNSVPTMDMKEVTQKLKKDAPIVLQLTSTDPDGDKITFSLEDPKLEGMTIDSATGRIVWKPQKKEKRAYQFSASASDPDGAKITKTFELKID